MADISLEIIRKQINGESEPPSGEGEAIKYITIKEARDFGVISEINRQVLHPMGLALEVRETGSGDFYISGIWDERDDPEGIIYGPDHIEAISRNNQRWAAEVERHAQARLALMGSIVQPVK